MLIVLIFIVCLLHLPAANASQFHFQLENDVTFHEDGNYSNGMIFGWESSAFPNKSNSSITIYNWQKNLFFPQDDAHQAWGLKVSQRMWTPAEIKISEVQPNDRPYAGFLEFEHRMFNVYYKK